MAIEVCGGSRVQGTLRVQGSKNAVLPIMAASVMVMVPTLIIFIVFQKQIVKGMTAGSVKG